METLQRANGLTCISMKLCSVGFCLVKGGSRALEEKMEIHSHLNGINLVGVVKEL